VCLRKSPARATADPSRIRRLLLIKLFGLGDIVLILPTVKALRQALPKTSVALLTCGVRYEVFRQNPLFDRVIDWNPRGCVEWWQSLQQLKSEEFDVVLDLEERSLKGLIISAALGAPVRVGFVAERSRGREVAYTHPVLCNPRQHMVHSFADAVRMLVPIPPFDSLIPLPVGKEAQRRVDLFLRQFGVSRRPLVGIQAGISPYNLAQRVWDLERFAAFADGLIDDCNGAVVLTGSPEQAGLNQEILTRMHHPAVNAAGKLTMEETIALVSACDLFLSSDTGTLHIAAAQGVPTIGLHGPESSTRYGPFGPGNHGFYKWVPCSPCTRPEYGIIGGCSAKTCLRAIEPEEVLAKARAMLFASAQRKPQVPDVRSQPA